VPSRRELALELGATHALDPRDGDVVAAIQDLTGGGADSAFDTTGIPAVVESTFTAMAPHAALGLVGVPTDPEASVNVSLMGALVAGVTVHGIIEGDSVPDEFIPRMAQLHAAGEFPFDKMVTKFPFAQINEAIEAQHKGEVVKAVLVH
jgi:aryl-alcohol dehydrogenase